MAAPARDEENPPADAPNTSDVRWAGWTHAEWLERLKRFGPGVREVEQALPRMIELAARTDAPPTLRQQVILMLGRVGSGRRDVVVALQRILDEPADGSNVPAAWAAKALSRMGPTAAEAVPALESALREESIDLSVRLGAIDALTQIGGSHPRVVPVLIEWLARPPVHLSGNEQVELRRAAADGLALLTPPPALAVPQLVRTLDDPDSLLRNKAIAALGSVGPGAAPAAYAVAERLVFDDQPFVREQAAAALAAMGPPGIDRLLHLSGDEEVEVRRLAMQGLRQTRSRSVEVRTILVERLSDSAETVQLEAAKALRDVANERGRVVEKLLQLLLSGDRAVRIEAANALANVNPSDEEVAATGLLDRIEESPTATRLWQRFRQQRLKSRP